MLCIEFLKQLPTFAADELSAGMRQRCEEHLGGCEECLELWLNRIDADNKLLPAAAAQSLTTNILQNTASNPCQTCEEILCEFVDGKIDQTQQHYLLLHLESCEDCRSISEALSGLAADLPLLAAVTPPVNMTGIILRNTLSWRQRINLYTNFPTFNFQNLVRRPRFSLEASFTITLMWMTIFGVPTSLSIVAEAEQLVPVDVLQVQQSLASVQVDIGQKIDNIPNWFTDEMNSLTSLSQRVFATGVESGQKIEIDAWQELKDWFGGLEIEFPAQEFLN